MAKPTNVRRATRPETREEFARRVGGVRMPSDMDPSLAVSGPVTVYRQRAVPADAVGIPWRHCPRRARPPRVTIGEKAKLGLTRAAAEHLASARVDVRYSSRTRQLWLIAAAETARQPQLCGRREGGQFFVTCVGMLRRLRGEHGIASGRYPAELVLTEDGRKALVVQFSERMQ